MTNTSLTFCRSLLLAVLVVLCWHFLCANAEDVVVFQGPANAQPAAAPTPTAEQPPMVASPDEMPGYQPGSSPAGPRRPHMPPGMPGKAGGPPAGPPAAPPGKPGEGGKPDETTKPIQRPIKPEAPSDPEGVEGLAGKADVDAAPDADIAATNGGNPVPANRRVIGRVIDSERAAVLSRILQSLLLGASRRVVLLDVNCQRVLGPGEQTAGNVEAPAYEAAFDTAKFFAVQLTSALPVNPVEIEPSTLAW